MLAAAVELYGDDRRHGLTGWTLLRTISQRVASSPDGRKIAAVCCRLEQEGLLERRKFGGGVCYRPTWRGRQLDADIAARTPARGGTFAPLNTIATMLECLALR